MKVYFRQVKWERAKCRSSKALAVVKGQDGHSPSERAAGKGVMESEL